VETKAGVESVPLQAGRKQEVGICQGRERPPPSFFYTTPMLSFLLDSFFYLPPNEMNRKNDTPQQGGNIFIAPTMNRAKKKK
jgi:hypothetical protein